MSRTVVITGATGGLGRAFASVFARQGDRLILSDLDSGACDALAVECGNDSVGHAFDLGDPAAMDRFWRWMDQAGIVPNVLLNNAGVGPSMLPTLATDPEDFAKVIDVNLVAATRMLDAAAARMPPGSAIVTTASLAGLVPNPRRNAYGAAKAALVALTEHAARDHAARGISVSGIAPGYVLTDMVATLAREGRIDLDAVRRRVPLGRLARPDEMASVVRFLASPEGAGCTGQTIPVDGGWSAFNMGGDACPNALAMPPEETEAVAGRDGAMLMLGQGDAGSDTLAEALGVSIGTTAERDEAASPRPEPVSCVVVPGARDDDLRERYRRDFNLLREAVRLALPLSGSVVYVAAAGSPERSAGLHAVGIAMLLRGMAAEFGPHGLRINGLFPGDATPATGRSLAHAVRFLSGHEASYVTGSILGVAGQR